jgi:hypothetical protein
MTVVPLKLGGYAVALAVAFGAAYAVGGVVGPVTRTTAGAPHAMAAETHGASHGAAGHLVSLRAGDLAYLHTHATGEGLRFATAFPTAGTYRLFLDFRHGDRVRTAAFTVHVGDHS